MITGERIKHRRKELGMSVDDLAEKVGKSRATIYRYENGEIEKLPTDVLEPIADALLTTPGYLAGWTDNPQRPKKRFVATFNLSSLQNALDKSISKEINDEVAKEIEELLDAIIYRIPIVRRVAAGLPLDSEEELLGYEEISEDMAESGNYFGLQIQGDSMEPGIRNGDIVIVRQQDTAEDGEIVVALINGSDGVCKRLKKYEDGSIALMSDNPQYQPLYFNGSEIDTVPIRICGIVKELRRKFQ